MKYKLFLLFSLIALISLNGQITSSLEKLGYAPTDKLLILHGDDLGVTHSVNVATFSGFQNGLLNSGSIMMPCPWFEEVKLFSLDYPQYDLGLHLTLTAEWKMLKWGGLADKINTNGLYNKDGIFYSDVNSVIKNATASEVEIELRAQIDKALKSGIKPTHLDSHMGTIFNKEEFISLYMKLGNEYKIPVFLPSQIFLVFPNLKEEITDQTIITDMVYMNNEILGEKEVFDYYDSILNNLSPGLNELIVHLGYDNDELQATCIEHPEYGSAWRQNDYNYIISPHLKSLIEKNNIKLVTWKEIQKALYK